MKRTFYLSVVITILVIISSCNKEENLKKIGLKWEVDHSSLLQPLIPDNSLSSYNGNPYLATTSRDDYRPILLKFDQEDGGYIDRWDTGLRAGISKNRLYFYGNQAYFIARETSVHGIDLNTMESVFDVPIDSRVNLHFRPLEDKIYLTVIEDSYYRICEFNLSTQNYRTILTLPPLKNQNSLYASRPTPYFTDTRDTAITTVAEIDGKIKLLSYNITEKDTIYEKDLNEFNEFDGQLRNTIVNNGYVYINSLNKVSCRDVETGELVWSKELFTTYNVPDPVFEDDYMFFAGTHLSCMSNKTGRVIWSNPEDQDGISWGSTTDYELHDDILFMSSVPMHAATGKPVKGWNKRDSYGNLTRPFKGLPTYDETSGNLYAVGEGRIFCLELP